MDTISLIIDDKKITIEKGKSVLEAALDVGIYIPHLCYHPDLNPIGTCGICIVEVAGYDELLPSCTTFAEAGMLVRTKTPQIEQMRRQVLEKMLVNHPPECVNCNKYLNCELQSVKQYVGITENVSVKTQVKPIPVDRRHPLFVHDFIRCIQCERCIRACNDLRGVGVLQMVEENGQKRVVIKDGKTLKEAGCRFCGACAEVCPTGAIRDREELLEGKKRKQALVPCRYACPAGINVPRYVRLVHEGKYAEATAVIREKVPFPKILGHVCSHPCEDVCRRGGINTAISIRNLKRFAAENDTERMWEKSSFQKPKTDNSVAVVGSGPAGLTAAYYLAKLGHSVTVFEALPKAGGMLRYGIPEYRLPRDVLDEEIAVVEKIGVEIKYSTRVESLEDLMDDEDFDAVVVTIGTHSGVKIPIPGADLDDVLIGTDFLRQVNLGNPPEVSKRVVVLGGGNVAFDCARVARRLGAKHVHMACLEFKDNMPAACDEIQEGEEEGIEISPGKTFKRIVSDNGKVTGVECLEVESFEFDEDGELQLEVVDGSESIIEGDMIIFAIGQRPEIPENFDIDLTDRKLIELDEYTFETSEEGIFAAGDAVFGTTSVIKAIASGRDAAIAVDKYLDGDGAIDETLAPIPEYECWLGPGENFAEQDRCEDCCVLPEERVRSFCCILESMDEASASAESERCLKCDIRFNIKPVKFWGDFQ